jgi:hypothetical protein
MDLVKRASYSRRNIMWTFGGMTSVGNGLEAEEELKNATD